MAFGRQLLAINSMLLVAPIAMIGQTSAATAATGPATLIIRTDDIGMSHSVDMAMQKLIATGLPVSVTVMFACPWYQEAVEMLRSHPNVSVGVHLVLNSEWRNYRWGPVTGREAVPTLVDSNGYFFPSAEALYRNHPDPTQVEKELRAQIERALHTGLKIDFMDPHMGTALDDPTMREIVERLAGEYGLGVMGYFGEAMESPQYRAVPAHKVDSLVALVNRLAPGVSVLVTHVGIDDAELGAMVDMNTGEPLADMSKNRQGELDALTSSRFSGALKARGIKLMTFRELIATQGLKAMHRPAS
jgi:predicted glycoside hydrolase/deacetylase ChbG (UPF0249 family)